MIRKNIRFLGVVALFWFAQYVFFPFFLPYLDMFSISTSIAGLITGVYGFSQLLLRIPLGIFADRLRNHKVFMFFGMCCLAAAGLLLFSASNPVMFLLARFLAGVAASTWVSFTVYFTSRFSNADTGRAAGTVLMANTLGIFLSYVSGTLIYEQAGIRTLFLISTGAALLGAVLIFTMRDDHKPEQTGISISDVISVVKDRNLLLHSMLATLTQVITFTTSMNFVSKYAEKIGASGRQIGIISIIFNGIGVLASLWIGTTASQKFTNRFKIILAFAFLGISCLIVPFSTDVTGIYISQIFGGIGRAFLLALTMGLALRDISPRLKSTAMGTYQSLYSIGMTLGPILMGIGLDSTGGNYQLLYYLAAFLCLLGLVWSAVTVDRTTL